MLKDIFLYKEYPVIYTDTIYKPSNLYYKAKTF